ncbi:MAG: hypothetical protein WCR51_02805 [Planctomycetia bacterium]
MSVADEGSGAAKLPTPRVSMYFDHPARQYAPAGDLVVRYDVEGAAPAVVRALERSVLWYTEGKGEEDIGVHHFERLDAATDVAEALPTGTITVRLPASPLSYEGIIVKIRWCVRIRLFFVAGRDYVSEHVFEVGDIAPARGTVERLP